MIMVAAATKTCWNIHWFYNTCLKSLYSAYSWDNFYTATQLVGIHIPKCGVEEKNVSSVVSTIMKNYINCWSQVSSFICRRLSVKISAWVCNITNEALCIFPQSLLSIITQCLSLGHGCSFHILSIHYSLTIISLNPMQYMLLTMLTKDEVVPVCVMKA
jgi:hypothetical protein